MEDLATQKLTVRVMDDEMVQKSEYMGSRQLELKDVRGARAATGAYAHHLYKKGGWLVHLEMRIGSNFVGMNGEK